MSRPIKPSEVAGAKVSAIPGAVFEAFNHLIATTWDGQRATVKQDEVIAEILRRMSTDRATVFDRHWLDIESAYEAEGWHVSYDKPGYNEFYPATFTFRASGRVKP